MIVKLGIRVAAEALLVLLAVLASILLIQHGIWIYGSVNPANLVRIPVYWYFGVAFVIWLFLRLYADLVGTLGRN